MQYSHNTKVPVLTYAHSDLSGNRFTGQLPRELLLIPLNLVPGTLYLRNLTVRRWAHFRGVTTVTMILSHIFGLGSQ